MTAYEKKTGAKEEGGGMDPSVKGRLKREQFSMLFPFETRECSANPHPTLHLALSSLNKSCWLPPPHHNNGRFINILTAQHKYVSCKML